MRAKSEFLQIRVSPAQKAALRRQAEKAGQDVSTWVLSRALPAPRLRFQELVRHLADTGERAFAMAELNDLLTGLPSSSFPETVADADLRGLPPRLANYVAAMVEHAASLKGCAPPPWTREVEVLDRPWFATDLESLRPWLLAVSPAPYRRRNLFLDAGLGDRV